MSLSSKVFCDKIVLMIAEDDLPKISEKTISNLQLPTVRALGKPILFRGTHIS